MESTSQRRFDILNKLYSFNILTKKALSKEFRVSERTIARDMEILLLDNLIEPVRGVKGGYRLSKDARDPKKQFLKEEEDFLRQIKPLMCEQYQKIIDGMMLRFGKIK